MAGKAEVFRLEPFSFDPLERSRLADLPPITPRFVLPTLDDVAGSPDRLLAGLKRKTRSRTPGTETKSLKGKEKELEVGPVYAEEIDREIEEDFWLNVMDREPGPSTPRLVKVCLQMPQA